MAVQNTANTAGWLIPCIHSQLSHKLSSRFRVSLTFCLFFGVLDSRGSCQHGNMLSINNWKQEGSKGIVKSRRIIHLLTTMFWSCRFLKLARPAPHSLHIHDAVKVINARVSRKIILGDLPWIPITTGHKQDQIGAYGYGGAQYVSCW